MPSRVRFEYEEIELSKNGNIPFERISPLPIDEISLGKRPNRVGQGVIGYLPGNELNIALILGNGLLLVIVGGFLGAG